MQTGGVLAALSAVLLVGLTGSPWGYVLMIVGLLAVSSAKVVTGALARLLVHRRAMHPASGVESSD